MDGFYPTMVVDPNGPWHHDEESGETWLVHGVRDPDLLDELRSGEVKIGDLIIEYQPHDWEKADAGWSQLSYIRDLIFIDGPDGDLKALVYLSPKHWKIDSVS